MKPTLRISFYLKRNECKPDGRCPVMGTITIGRSRACFSTKMRVPIALWISGADRVNGRTKEAAELNAELDEYRASAYKHFHELSKRFDNVTAVQVKQAVQGMACAFETLMKVFSSHNEEYRKRIGISRVTQTMRHYDMAYKRLTDFLNKKYHLSDISFQQLNTDFIENYDRYLSEEVNLNPSSILTYTNPLRKMVKIAIGKGLIDRDPFAQYKPQRVKHEPRYLSKADFDKLVDTPLENENLGLVRDMFLLASFTGLAYRDMYNLTDSNLVRSPDGRMWIEINRQKSGARSNIPLMPVALEIIERYRGIPKNGNLLPMYSSGHMNQCLKILAEKCGIEANLYFHVARHTFATQHTLSRGVPIESVSHMLGHSSISSTQIYAEVTDEKIHREIKACKDQINASYKLVNLND